MEAAFLDAHRNVAADWAGLRHANLIEAGEGRYCLIPERESPEALSAARPQMIATLTGFRSTLEYLGGGLGVTGPVSGPVAFAIK